jgi:hypothetical protein
MKILYCACIALVLFIVLAVLPAAAATYNATIITQGATVFVGESGLNISGAAMSFNTDPATIAWFPSTAQPTATTPEMTIVLTPPTNISFYVNPADFATRTGNWYCWTWTSSIALYQAPLAFTVADPQLDLKIWDLDQGNDVTGQSVPSGERLTFRLETNGYLVANPSMRPYILQPSWASMSDGSYYGFDPATGFPLPKTAEGFIDIKVKTDQGNILYALYNATGGQAVPLFGMWVNTNPWYWGNTTSGSSLGYYWNTNTLDGIGQKVYPPGTYTVTAEFNLNGIKDNYQNNGADYAGKTVSEARTITLVADTVKIEANKDTVVRRNPFSVTITGRPSTFYWVWVKGTGSMSGGVDDQPPYIPLNQAGVYLGTLYSNYTPQNKGQNISVGHPSTPPGYNYWAMIKTNANGLRTVEFSTSNQTKLQTYTIRVENYSSGEYKSDEVNMKVENGAVTLGAAGNQKYDIGEEIQFSGTNTVNAITYLFLSGPGLPPEGAQLQSTDPRNTAVVNGVASTFAQAAVLSDNTWGWQWQTDGISLVPGLYTIVASTEPVDALHLANASSYASILIVVKNQSIENFIPLYPGWNFVSTPKKLLIGYDTANIFSTVDTAAHSIFFYNASEQRWHSMTIDEKVRPLDGIWIYSNNPTIVTITFDTNSTQTPPSKSLAAGWNAIGFSDTTPTLARDALISVQNKWAILIGYNPLQQKYETSIIKGATDSSHGDQLNMYPTKGYWVYMTEAGEIASIGL